MFAKKSTGNPRMLLPGVTLTPLCSGEKTNMGEFRLQKGYRIPPHSHPFEQTGYLISGRVKFRIGEKWHETLPGDSWCIAGNIEHEVDITEDSVIVEIFSPVRKDYL